MTYQQPRADSGMRRRANLRRADWRFLLPASTSSFQHLVLLGGTCDLADHILQSGVASRVSLTLPGQRTADAVAVLSHTRVQFADVANSLMPGGGLYYEVDRRSPTHILATPGRVMRELRRAGLTPTGIYWAAPDFANCKRYIPLDLPEAFQWYLSTLFVAGTPLHRLLEINVRLFLNIFGNRFGAIAPCFAVTAIHGKQANPIPFVLAHPAFPAELKVPGLRAVLLTSGQDDASRAVILPFAPGHKVPIAVFKVSPNADFNVNTEREQIVLRTIRSHLDEGMQRTIPAPFGLGQYGDVLVGMESYAAGNPILVTSGQWIATFKQQTDDLRLAAGWLGKFHRQADVGRCIWDEAAIERWIETSLASYERVFGLTGNEERLFSKVRSWARTMIGASLPLVWMHYDFAPWNIYRNRDELTVIDWEFGRDWERDRVGPALYDLLYYVTYWNHVVQHLNTEAEELQGLQRLFITTDLNDRYSTSIHQVITDYMASLEIDHRFLPLILVFMWVEQALHQFLRKRTLGELNPNPRVGNRCVRYLAVLADHADQLFNMRTTHGEPKWPDELFDPGTRARSQQE